MRNSTVRNYQSGPRPTDNFYNPKNASERSKKPRAQTDAVDLTPKGSSFQAPSQHLPSADDLFHLSESEIDPWKVNNASEESAHPDAEVPKSPANGTNCLNPTHVSEKPVETPQTNPETEKVSPKRKSEEISKDAPETQISASEEEVSEVKEVAKHSESGLFASLVLYKRKKIAESLANIAQAKARCKLVLELTLDKCAKEYIPLAFYLGQESIVVEKKVECILIHNDEEADAKKQISSLMPEYVMQGQCFRLDNTSFFAAKACVTKGKRKSQMRFFWAIDISPFLPENAFSSMTKLEIQQLLAQNLEYCLKQINVPQDFLLPSHESCDFFEFLTHKRQNIQPKIKYLAEFDRIFFYFCVIIPDEETQKQ